MPALTAEQALELVRAKLEELTSKGEGIKEVDDLLEAIKPENIFQPITTEKINSDRYKGLIRWFGPNIRYFMSLDAEENIGVAIDEKLEEEEARRDAFRQGR